MEAKLLQTAASLRTFFVLVKSTQALKSLVELKIAFASLRGDGSFARPSSHRIALLRQIEQGDIAAHA